MLKAAAERGVKVYIIVYKEVAQALTCKFLNLAEVSVLITASGFCGMMIWRLQ